MKKIMKIAAMLTLIALCAVMVISCGKTETPNDTTPAPDTTAAPGTAAPAPDTAGADDNVIVMCTNASFPPYEFVENGEITGIDAEIAAKIAEKLGMTLKIEDMEFSALIPAVQSGLADFAMAGMTVNEERLQSVNFSTSYATGVQVVIIPEGSDIASLDDLNGKKIGVQLATTGDIYATDDYGEENVEEYATGNDAVLALTQGKVDAVIIDNEPAKAYVAANEGLTILSTEYAVEDYAIAIAKENTELLDKVNAALAELIDDGVVTEIVNKYIG